MGKNSLRRSMLYIPGNNPGMIQDANIYGADSILLDLEDSVVVSEKDAARKLVSEALREIDFSNLEITVRINPLTTEFGQKDLEVVVPSQPDALRLPKTENAKEVKEVDKLLSKIEKNNNLEIGRIEIMPMLETALGVLNAYEIATSSERVSALTIGGEDLTADLGVKRTASGEEIFTARSSIVLAATAAGVDALDTIYSKVDDIEGLIEETKFIKQLGFSGKAVIHPKQIKAVHQVFTPTEEEISESKKIIKEAEKAESEGLGVITVNGKMVDGPIIDRARKILNYSKQL